MRHTDAVRAVNEYLGSLGQAPCDWEDTVYEFARVHASQCDQQLLMDLWRALMEGESRQYAADSKGLSSWRQEAERAAKLILDAKEGESV